MGGIAFFFEDIQPLEFKKLIINKYVKCLITNELRTPGNINIVLCSDGYLLKMNQQYLEHNYYTDIITFNYVENSTISGDLFLSFDRIVENAKTYDTDFKKELFRVIFHGILHLIGYKDKTNGEKKLMREKEDFYLEMVNFEEFKL